MNSEICNLNFERAILSAIIYNPEIFEEIAAKLDPLDFCLPFHQYLFVAMDGLVKEELPIDEEFLRSKLLKINKFDETLMLDLLAASPISNYESYINEIKEYARLREFKQLAHQILQSVQKNEGLSDTLHTLHEGIERIEEGGRELFNIVSFGEIEAKDAEFVCKSWLPFPKDTVSLVTAGGGVGKSFLLLQAAMRMAKDENLKIFMWLSEDPLALSKYRFEMIAKQILESDSYLFEKNIHLSGADSETIHFLEESRAGISISSKFYQFKRALKSYDVIILDPLIAMFGGDENNNSHARLFINLFTRWATKEKKTIIFIHHGTKNTSQSRGASAFVDAVRLVYRVEYIKDDKGETVEEENRYVILDKDNNGARKYLGSNRVKRQIYPKKKARVEIEYS
ncbi:MAG: AAA family ATPase [Epsilonproteobacteria bacterium]|nr:AAA family ATPase [Campylobacterota bacterium]